MKIRCGFVSNSSSSSTIILIPKGGLKLTITDEIRQVMKNEEVEDVKKIQSSIKMLNNGKSIWRESIGYGVAAVLDKIVGDYEIASIDVSSEAGQIVPVLQKEVDDILKKHG